MRSMMSVGDIVGTERAAYRLVYELGAGGMGEVWEARDLLSSSIVAIKFMRDDRDALPARFRREARLLKSLSHPNIVKLIDEGETHDGKPFLVLELLSGETIHSRLKQRGPLPPRDAVEVARQVASALAASHAIGIVHRDLKPGNVFLCDNEERAVVFDFGIAKDLGTTNRTELTEAGGVVGSLGYMSPEQLEGVDVDRRTDIWAIGMLIFEMIERRPMFQAANIAMAVRYLQRGVVPIPWRVTVPREIDFLVTSCLELKPAKRIQSAQELVDKLTQVLESSALWDVPRQTSGSSLSTIDVHPIDGLSVMPSDEPVVETIRMELAQHARRENERHHDFVRRVTRMGIGLAVLGVATLIVSVISAVQSVNNDGQRPEMPRPASSVVTLPPSSLPIAPSPGLSPVESGNDVSVKVEDDAGVPNPVVTDEPPLITIQFQPPSRSDWKDKPDERQLPDVLPGPTPSSRTHPALEKGGTENARPNPPEESKKKR